MRSNIVTVAAVTSILTLAACGSTPGERALTGGAIGAGAGAVGGSVVGGDPVGGAVLGGAAGAIIGAVTADERRGRRGRRYRY
ncbi:MAG: hypothetical protein AAF416_13115 [Pseudomonadota bacterium]